MTKVDCSLEQGVCYRYRHGHQRETLTSVVAGDACLLVGETCLLYEFVYLLVCGH